MPTRTLTTAAPCRVLQLLAKEQETHFARLGKLEAMSSKLQTTYEITVKAIHCKEVRPRPRLAHQPLFSLIERAGERTKNSVEC